MKRLIWIGLTLIAIAVMLALLVNGMISAAKQEAVNTTPQPFRSELWQEKNGSSYPHRTALLEAVLYTDTIRNMTADEALNALGEPDRRREDYLYYRISSENLSVWTVYARDIVIKLEGDSVEWIKLHE